MPILTEKLVRRANKKNIKKKKTKMGRKIGRVNKITVLPFLQFKKDTN